MNNFPTHSSYAGLHLFNETGQTLPLSEKDITRITEAIKQHEDCDFTVIEVVFVDEDQILQINNKHLNHNYVTDIITFQYSEEIDLQHIEGTLYCCYNQIEQQAADHNQPIKPEFLRVVIHGLLHLCGYDDKSGSDQKKMTQKENFYLDKLFNT